jgi:hypothetical protein
LCVAEPDLPDGLDELDELEADGVAAAEADAVADVE